MILYQDTSSAIKLFVDEPGADAVRRATRAADAVAISRIGYAEARAALARKRRERLLSSAQYRSLKEDIDRDWDSYLIIEVNEKLVKLSAELVERRPLRTLDAIHLASALQLREMSGMEVWFASSDTRLAACAKKEGLRTITE